MWEGFNNIRDGKKQYFSVSLLVCVCVRVLQSVWITVCASLDHLHAYGMQSAC